MESGELGKTYQDGEIIVREGDPGDRMYVVLSGKVTVSRHLDGKEILIAELGKQDLFGEMALFEKSTRSATVRALGPVRVMTVDKKTFLRRVHEDPSLAYSILQQLSRRLRVIDAELANLRGRAADAAATLLTAPPSVDSLQPRRRLDVLKYFLSGWRARRSAASGNRAADAGAAGRRRTEQRRGDRRRADRRQARPA